MELKKLFKEKKITEKLRDLGFASRGHGETRASNFREIGVPQNPRNVKLWCRARPKKGRKRGKTLPYF